MYTISLTDTLLKDQQTFSFEMRTISDNGIIRAIKQHKDEINKLFSYVVKATISVIDNDTNKQHYNGVYTYDCFSGHGEIELKHIRQND